jgi:hypothetical protein
VKEKMRRIKFSQEIPEIQPKGFSGRFQNAFTAHAPATKYVNLTGHFRQVKLQ